MPFTPDQVLFLDEDNIYGADELGLPYRDIMGEGVVSAGDLLVGERGAGPNMSVDIAAGACWIKGDDSATLQPTYRYREAATTNVVVTTADPTNPRKDIVIAEIRDSTFAGVNRDGRLRVVAGTPAGSPVEPALPSNAIKLAVIDIPANDTTIGAAQITDTRQRAKVGGGVAQSAGGAILPIDLRNPRVTSLAGNSFFTTTGLTDWDFGHWEFVKDVDGKVYGVVRFSGLTAAVIRLAIAANATTGVTRLSVRHKTLANAESINPSSLTAITSQDVTVPATANLRKDVTFTVTETLTGKDLMIVEIFHEGAHANDTLAVNTLLVGAWLEAA